MSNKSDDTECSNKADYRGHPTNLMREKWEKSKKVANNQKVHNFKCRLFQEGRGVIRFSDFPKFELLKYELDFEVETILIVISSFFNVPMALQSVGR